MAWHRERFRLTPDDRTTLVGSPGFDLSVWECRPTLTGGASLHVPDAETLLSPPDLQRWLVDEGITVGLFPTPVAEALLARPRLSTGRLRVLHAGGDRLTVRPGRSVSCEIYNSYGPTESTVLCTTGPVTAAAATGAASGSGPPCGVQSQELSPSAFACDRLARSRVELAL